MTGNGVHPVANRLDKTYNFGVRVARAAFKAITSRLQPDNDRPKYELLIKPQSISRTSVDAKRKSLIKVRLSSTIPQQAGNTTFLGVAVSGLESP
jgi:hypothetical protein